MSRDNIPGRCAYTWIYDDFLKSNPKRGAVVVEVGVALGKGLSYLAEACIASDRRDIQIYAVDPWGGYAQNGEQQEYAAAVGGDFTLYAKMMLDHCPEAFELIRPLRTTGVLASRLFDKRSVSLVLLDGAHDYATVADEIRAWAPKLGANGVMGGDDHHPVEFPGVIRACEEYFGAGTYEVRTEHDWPTWRAILHQGSAK